MVADGADIDDAQDFASVDERDGQHTFILVLRQLRDELEARVLVGVVAERNRFFVLGHPPRNALADFQAQLADHFPGTVGDGPQDKRVVGVIEQIHLRRVRAGDLHGAPGNGFEHFFQIKQRPHRLADALQGFSFGVAVVVRPLHLFDLYRRRRQLGRSGFEGMVQPRRLRFLVAQGLGMAFHKQRPARVADAGREFSGNGFSFHRKSFL